MTTTFVFNCIAKKAYYSQPNEIFLPDINVFGLYTVACFNYSSFSISEIRLRILVGMA